MRARCGRVDAMHLVCVTNHKRSWDSLAERQHLSNHTPQSQILLEAIFGLCAGVTKLAVYGAKIAIHPSPAPSVASHSGACTLR